MVEIKLLPTAVQFVHLKFSTVGKKKINISLCVKYEAEANR